MVERAAYFLAVVSGQRWLYCTKLSVVTPEIMEFNKKVLLGV